MTLLDHLELCGTIFVGFLALAAFFGFMAPKLRENWRRGRYFRDVERRRRTVVRMRGEK